MPLWTGSSVKSRGKLTGRDRAGAIPAHAPHHRTARNDLRDIRSYSVEQYGTAGADAYDAVLRQASRDIREGPLRPGIRERPETGKNIRSYHTALSKERAAAGVGSPRHFLVYYLPRDEEVVISRVLHDSRDLARHVPNDRLEQAAIRELTRKKPPRGPRRDGTANYGASR